MLLTIISFVIVLGILVFIHELGHYLVARRNGIVVEEFGMGYPPRVAKLFHYDGTDFTLNLIPFGGFARMKGEDMGDTTPGSFNAAGIGARAATLAAGPLMNALLAIVLFAASYMAGFPAAAAYPLVTSVAPGSPAQAAGVQPNDVLIELNGAPVLISAVRELQYNVVPQRAADPSLRRLTVVREGELTTLTLDGTLPAEQLLAAVTTTPVLSTQVTLVVEDTPAAAAGLQPGDLIFAVNDTVVSRDNPLNVIIQRHLGQTVTLSVLRDGEWVTTQVTPRAAPPPGQGALGIQIGTASRLATMPMLPALWQGVRSTLDYVLLVLQLPVLLFVGQVSPADAQLTGPVGIAQLVGGAVEATMDTGLWFPILRLSAVLSAALAITNLLPLPALDGGRMLFILFEAIRGRRINPEREGLIHMVGFMLLLGLLVLITVRDITTAQQAIDWASILGQ